MSIAVASNNHPREITLELGVKKICSYGYNVESGIKLQGPRDSIRNRDAVTKMIAAIAEMRLVTPWVEAALKKVDRLVVGVSEEQVRANCEAFSKHRDTDVGTAVRLLRRLQAAEKEYEKVEKETGLHEV